MKFILLNILFLCSLRSSVDPKELFEKIANHEIITKTELEKQLFHKFSNYEDKFIGTGNMLSSGDILAGVIQGKRNDTIFDILIVFKDSKCLSLKENPNASFYRKEEIIQREYMLGRIYTTYKEKDTTCIKAYIETIQPFKIDTLAYKFKFDMGEITSRDSLCFCIEPGRVR